MVILLRTKQWPLVQGNKYYMHVRRSVKSSGEIKEYNDKGSLTQEEREELTIQQHCFTLVISADYQQ